MSAFWIIGCSVLAAIAAGILVSDSWFGHGQRIDRRISLMRREANVSSTETSRLFRDLKLVETGRHEIRERLRRFVEQSAIPITLPRLFAISGFIGVGGGLALLPLRGSMAIAPAVGLVLASLPLAYVAWKRRRRIELLRSQLPDAFDSMGRAVQAGQSVPSALQIVATESRQPLAKEFACACEQHNLGLSFEQSLQDLSQRVPVPELRIFAIALIVQRQAGGNPIEIIANMSELIRKRAKLAGRIRALTGEGRMQAIVLTLLPIVAFLGLWLGRPDYIHCLIERPRILQALLAAQILATVWIRRIIRLDF